PVDPLAARLAAELGRDRGASRGQLVEGRDREVAVEGQRERARDGRGAHDEHVDRFGAAALERRALEHAEAMLLVDDGEPEAPEGRALLGEPARAAGEQAGATGQPGAPAPP